MSLENTNNKNSMLQNINSVFCHVDMDAFFVSAEVSRNKALKGKPVVVGGGAGKRLGVVAAASYEARKFGIFSGTPISEAKSKCSSLVIIHPDFKFYNQLSEKIIKAIEKVSPDIQVLSIDEALVELTNVLRIWKTPLNAASTIKKHIKEETSLPCTIGISRFPVLAKMCSNLAKPDGILFALPGYEEKLLSEHDISSIPGIGKALTKYFKYYNINTVGQLATKEKIKWEKMLISKSPSKIFPKSISAAITLDEDCKNRAKVKRVLSFLCAKCGTKLRKYNLTANFISVTIRYSDFSSFSSKLKASHLTYDNDIKFYAKKLFEKTDNSSLPIRLIGVRLWQFSPYCGMPIIHSKKHVKTVEIQNTIDKIREKYNSIEKIQYF